MTENRQTAIDVIHVVTEERDIGRLVHIVRGKQVMIDSDLAALYGVETKNLNKAVTRNSERFPEDFRFRLTKEEFDQSCPARLKPLENVGYDVELLGKSRCDGIRYCVLKEDEAGHEQPQGYPDRRSERMSIEEIEDLPLDRESVSRMRNLLSFLGGLFMQHMAHFLCHYYTTKRPPCFDFVGFPALYMTKSEA